MRFLTVFVAVMVFRLSDAMPFNDILSDFSVSGQAPSDTGSSGGSQYNVHRVVPEVDADFEGIEDKASTSEQSEPVEDHKSDRESLSGSGEEQDEPLFRETTTKETESRFHGEAEQHDESGDQQEPISGSGGDPTGANFWAVVRVEPDTDDRGNERELHVNRRSEKFIPEESTKASDEGSASGNDASGKNVSQKSELPIKSSSGQEDNSGDNASQRNQLPVTSTSRKDVASGEDDAPFDTSSTESELDSGCSSGEGCYESEGVQGEEDLQGNSRSVIAKPEAVAVASGSAATSGDSSNNVWLHPHFDVLAGPYDEKALTSGAAPLSSGSGSGSELGNVLHDIEDAIFETGVPVEITRDAVSGSGLPSPPLRESQNDSPTSGSGTGEAEKEEDVQLFVAPQHHAERINLMEKMMKEGKLQAFKISHMANVGGTSRNKVPRLDLAVQSDLGKGKKVSFVLNQDFHDGYADENSAAYDILANSVKKEVEKVLGSNAVVSEISFSEVREPGQTPSFSKVMTSLKLLGDVSKLENKVKKGAINNLMVDKKFFHVI